ADFSQPANGKCCADLGTGCGTIPLLWLKRADRLRVTAVELQEDACSLLQRSISHNHLEEQLTVLHADLGALKGVLPFGAFDTVVCNPPL
ncbi:MAG: methyltransferase, partial [Ruminococcus sp.]|nr:methyltransferase [Ruminococcus sp.]